MQAAAVPPQAVAGASSAQAVARETVNTASVGGAAQSDQFREALDKVRKAVQQSANNLEFSVEEDLGITVVRLVDTETQVVIRQIPTEEVIRIAKSIDTMKGLLFQDQA